tara:strand:- start:1749 stop:2966 length:1218 start_codon:yes stop_codon:yes gene_type:complete
MELDPESADISGQTIIDSTAPTGLEFHFAKGAKPLSTPWQLAVERARLVRKAGLMEGLVLDPACGSGIQLAAYVATLGRKGVGIEMDYETAVSANRNLARVHMQGFSDNVRDTRIRVGDGTKGDSGLRIALLHLDPARPRNSRKHSLDEMKPSLDAILSAWKDNMQTNEFGPAILLDLSPRLSETQRLEVEEIVESFWPNTGKTWTWTSRGGGRVDRLSLWVGQLSNNNAKRRYLRIPPSSKSRPYLIEGNPDTFAPLRRLPKKGDYVTILDSALVNSGLATTFIKSKFGETEFYWSEISGRRPQIHHQSKLKLDGDGEKLLIQATGKVVSLIHCDLNADNIPLIVMKAREFGFGKLTLRLTMKPSMQPALQGSIDRQLSATGGESIGFIAKQPEDSMLMLCLEK